GIEEFRPVGPVVVVGGIIAQPELGQRDGGIDVADVVLGQSDIRAAQRSKLLLGKSRLGQGLSRAAGLCRGRLLLGRGIRLFQRQAGRWWIEGSCSPTALILPESRARRPDQPDRA